MGQEQPRAASRFRPDLRAQPGSHVQSDHHRLACSFTYYDGCSTGGREALTLAQRYPRDFNGIIAGAPAGNLAPLTLFTAWLVRSNTGPDGHQILTSEKIPALHTAVMRACGNAHGIITDPRHCGFNPASIQCPPGKNTQACLTPAQVRAVRKFYRGPADMRGRSLYNGGQPYGSELGWTGNFVEPAADRAAPADTSAAALARNYLKYMAFLPNPPASFTLADVKFTDAEFAKLNLLGNAIYNANVVAPPLSGPASDSASTVTAAVVQIARARGVKCSSTASSAHPARPARMLTATTVAGPMCWVPEPT